MTLRYGKRVALILVIALVVVLALEGLTRLFLSSAAAEPVIPIIGRFDERLGWAKTPLARGTSERTGYEIEYRINSKGLRDDETTYDKPEGTFRIVLLGDSNTFGFGVPIERHFSTLLEGYFDEVEVINMGIDGFGVDQELLYLRSEGFRYEPDLVLAYVPHYSGHRHMHTARFGKNKPRFVLKDGVLVLTNSPVENKARAKTPILRDIDQWLAKRSRAYQIFYAGLNLLITKQPSADELEQLDEQNAENDRFVSNMHKLGEALIFAMDEETSAHGAKFVLVTKIDELHQATLDRGGLSLDVSAPLANPKFSLPNNLKHLNESGNGVLAWEIVQFLQANQLIPEAHSGR